MHKHASTWAVVSVSELEAGLQNALEILSGVILDWGRLVCCVPAAAFEALSLKQTVQAFYVSPTENIQLPFSPVLSLILFRCVPIALTGGKKMVSCLLSAHTH